MPFKSMVQQGYLYANKPDVARKFAQHAAKKGDALPSKISQPVHGKARNNA